MNDEKRMITTGTYLELSDKHKSYLELENLVCYYDYPNGNGRQIDYGDTPEEQEATLQKAQTLCLMPVYAKCTVNAKGEPTFKGHEAKKGLDGEWHFDTIPIGVHSSVHIERKRVTTADGQAKTLPVLISSQRIWKRNKNAVAAIKRLFDGGNLHNSWEIETSEYKYKDGIKHLTNYEFLGNTFIAQDAIGGGAAPAYGDDGAKVLSVASQDNANNEENNCELMIAEALSQDMVARNGVNSLEDMKKELAETTEGATTEEQKANSDKENDNAEIQNENKQSPTLNEDEAQCGKKKKVCAEETDENQEAQCGKKKKVCAEEGQDDTQEAQCGKKKKACAEQSDNSEKSVAEQAALTDRNLRRKIEEAYSRYRASQGGHAEWPDIRYWFPADNMAWMQDGFNDGNELDFNQIAYKVTEDNVDIISSEPITLVASPREMNMMISQKDATINSLNQQVAELSEYKAKFEAVEAANAKAKHEQEIAELTKYARDAKCFSEADFVETSELMQKINAVEVASVKSLIADKLVAREVEKAQIESSAQNKLTNGTPKANLEGEVVKTRHQVMVEFLR